MLPQETIDSSLITFYNILSWEVEKMYLWMTVNLTVNHPLSILAIQEKEMNGVRYYQLSFCLRNTMGPRL